MRLTMREGTQSELSAIRSYPHVEIRRSHTDLTTDSSLFYCGKHVAERQVRYKRRSSARIYSDYIQVDGEFLDIITNGGDMDAWRLGLTPTEEVKGT